MNKWLYRAAGAVGVASGTLLLSSGVAHAETTATVDPQAMRDGVAQYFTPSGPALDGGREEFIGGLLGGGGGSPLGGLTGGLGGLTGGKGGNSLLSGLTGGGDLLGSVTGTVTGGANPISDLTGGLGGLAGGGDPLGSLTGGGSPLSSLTGGLTDDGGPLKTVTGGLTSGDGAVGAVTSRLTGKLLGGGGQPDADDPLSGFLTQDHLMGASQAPASTDTVDPTMRGTAVDIGNQRGIQLDPATARQVNDATAPMVSALIADAVTKHIGISTDAALSEPAMAQDTPTRRGSADEEGFPLVNELPLVGALLGGDGPLGKVVAVGDLHKGIPLVGPALDGQFSVDSVSKLPVVGTLLNNGLLKTSDGPGLPVVGNLPFVGGALNSLGAKTPTAPTAPTAPNLPGMLPPGAANLPGMLPAQTLPAPAAGTAQGPLSPTARDLAPAGGNRAGAAAAQGPLHVGKHRATERPELTDPDYLESGTLPLVGSLTGGDLPLIGPLLKQLPLVGGLL